MSTGSARHCTLTRTEVVRLVRNGIRTYFQHAVSIHRFIPVRGHRNESAVLAPLQKFWGRKWILKFLIAKTRNWLAFLSFFLPFFLRGPSGNRLSLDTGWLEQFIGVKFHLLCYCSEPTGTRAECRLWPTEQILHQCHVNKQLCVLLNCRPSDCWDRCLLRPDSQKSTGTVKEEHCEGVPPVKSPPSEEHLWMHSTSTPEADGLQQQKATPSTAAVS